MLRVVLRFVSGLLALNTLLIVSSYIVGRAVAGSASVVDLAQERRQLIDLSYGVVLEVPVPNVIFSPDRRSYLWLEWVEAPQRQVNYRLRSLDGRRDELLFSDDSLAVRSLPVWSPDGQRIAFQQKIGVDTLFIIYQIADRHVAAQWVPALPVVAGYVWWPDGSKLLVAAQFDTQYDLATLDVADGRLTQLTQTPHNETQPLITADGQTILFMSDAQGAQDIYAMSVADGEIKRLTDGRGLYAPHSVSADGQWLLFVQVSAELRAAFRMNLNTGECWPVPYALGARLQWW